MGVRTFNLRQDPAKTKNRGHLAALSQITQILITLSIAAPWYIPLILLSTLLCSPVMVSPDDMYIDDEVDKGAGKLTNGRELDLIRSDYSRKEKHMQDIIHSLEEEVIKLQLENMLLSVTTPGIG